MDGTLTVTYGPHIVGRYNAQGLPLLPEAARRRRRETAVEKPRRRASFIWNRTDHVLQKPDILICKRHIASDRWINCR
jgi:hypothetical protein